MQSVKHNELVNSLVLRRSVLKWRVIWLDVNLAFISLLLPDMQNLRMMLNADLEGSQEVFSPKSCSKEGQVAQDFNPVWFYNTAKLERNCTSSFGGRCHVPPKSSLLQAEWALLPQFLLTEYVLQPRPSLWPLLNSPQLISTAKLN